VRNLMRTLLYAGERLARFAPAEIRADAHYITAGTPLSMMGITRSGEEGPNRERVAMQPADWAKAHYLDASALVKLVADDCDDEPREETYSASTTAAGRQAKAAAEAEAAGAAYRCQSLYSRGHHCDAVIF
jgi:hypothetical protein